MSPAKNLTRRTVAKSLGLLLARGTVNSASIRPLDLNALVPPAEELDAETVDDSLDPWSFLCATDLREGPWVLAREPVGEYFTIPGGPQHRVRVGVAVWQFNGSPPTTDDLTALFDRASRSIEETLADVEYYGHERRFGHHWVELELSDSEDVAAFQEVWRLQRAGPIVLGVTACGFSDAREPPQACVARFAARMVSRMESQGRDL